MAYKNTIQEGLRSKILFKYEAPLFLFFSYYSDFPTKKEKKYDFSEKCPSFCFDMS